MWAIGAVMRDLVFTALDPLPSYLLTTSGFFYRDYHKDLSGSIHVFIKP